MKKQTIFFGICAALALSLGAVRANADSEISNLADGNGFVAKTSATIRATILQSIPKSARPLFLGQWQPWKNRPAVMLCAYMEEERTWLEIWEKTGTKRPVRYVMAQRLNITDDLHPFEPELSTTWADGSYKTPVLIVNLGEDGKEGSKKVITFTSNWKTDAGVYGPFQYSVSESPFGLWRTVSIRADENGNLKIASAESDADHAETETLIWNRRERNFIVQAQPTPTAKPGDAETSETATPTPEAMPAE